MILSNVVSYGVQVMVLLLAGLSAPRLLRLRAPAVSLRYWQLLLAVVLLLPLVQPWRDAAVDSATVEMVGHMVMESVAAAVPAGASRQVVVWLAAVVAVVAVLRISWIIAGLAALGRLRRKARPVADVPAAISEISRRLGVDSEVMESDDVRVPVTFGWLRPVVVLPPAFGDLPEAQQIGVVCHELLHVARHDWLKGVVEQVARAFLWFHPAVPILLGRIALSREQLIDAEVVRITHNRRGYLDALWSIARHGRQTAVLPALPLLNRSDLFERVAVLTEEVDMSKRRMIATAAAAVAAVAVAGAAAAAAFPFIRAATPVLAASASADEAAASERSDGRPDTIRFEPNGDVTEPKLIYKVNPKYPEEARKNRIMGNVVCRTVITAGGEVTDVEIVETDDEIFNQATIDAVSQWRFEPATLEGEPVDVYYVVTVRFNLSKDKPKSDE